MMAPAAGRFSQGRPSAGGSRRQPTRSRYVDTFNTGGTPADSDLMPPPAARPKAPAPTYKVFTPQRPAGAEAEEPAPGAATPLFMTPTSDVYANMPDGAADAVDANAPTQ